MISDDRLDQIEGTHPKQWAGEAIEDIHELIAAVRELKGQDCDHEWHEVIAPGTKIGPTGVHQCRKCPTLMVGQP